MTPEEMQDRDIVEFTDDSGNTLMLEVMDYFYYNGQEFAALCDAQENPSDDEPDDDPVYIMQVNTFEDENGEEMEEFVPPEEKLMEKPLYFDTSFSGDYLQKEGVSGMLTKEAFVDLIHAMGSDRVLFGTDSPWSGQKDAVQWFMETGMRYRLLCI